jgi:hypothetical protein
VSEVAIVVRTEVFGLDVCLGSSVLALTREGEPVIAPIVLSSADAERLRLEMAKAQLWEWNLLEELKTRSERCYKHYLGSWLVLCLAAFSAYIGYPGYYLPLFLTLLSIFVWWRSGHEERKADRATREERKRFVADWSYFQQRAEEAP